MSSIKRTFFVLAIAAGAALPISPVAALDFGVVDRNQYGFGFEGGDHREAYTTTFGATGTDSLLSVDGFDVDAPGEVTVWLNGSILGSLLKTGNNQTKRTALFVSAAQQQSQNTLKFIQSQPGFRWGVKNLLIHDLDASPIKLTLNRAYRRQLGFRYGDRRRYSGLEAQFTATGTDLELEVVAWNITAANALRLVVNDRLRGHVTTGRGRHKTRRQRFFIPASWLRAGSNQIRFELAEPGKTWGIDSLLLRKRPTGRPSGALRVIRPGDNVAAIVNASPAGTKFYLRRGRHRVAQISPKTNQVFYCERNAIITGARPLQGVWRKAGGLWYLDGAPRPLPGNGVMSAGHGVNRIRNDVFVDDARYLRVSRRDRVDATPRSVALRPVYAGTFFQEGSRLWLPIDPRDRRVEIAEHRWAFFAAAGAGDGVTIENCVVEKYAPEDLEGAIEAKFTTGWVLKNVTARFNHTGGLRIGRDTTVIGGRYNDNGQTGIVGSLVGEGGPRFGYSDNVLVDGAQIAGNNWKEFDSAWHGGGVKFYRTRGVVMVANRVHHNFGPGIWVDWDVYNTVIDSNRIYRNAGLGVAVEAAFFGRVTNNQVKCNATLRRHSQNYTWFWGAQILVKNSPNITVTGNDIVVDHGQGIGIGDNLDRGSNPRYGRREARNNTVSGNTVAFTSRQRNESSDGWTGVNSDAPALAAGLDASSATAGNVVAGNTYQYSEASYPHWVVGNGRYPAFGAPPPWEQGSQFQLRSDPVLSEPSLCP